MKDDVTYFLGDGGALHAKQASESHRSIYQLLQTRTQTLAW